MNFKSQEMSLLQRNLLVKRQAGNLGGRRQGDIENYLGRLLCFRLSM